MWRIDEQQRMARVQRMRDQLPHDGAVLPEIADPVAVHGVHQDHDEHERGERGVAEPKGRAQTSL
jgi:hypothetical protein